MFNLTEELKKLDPSPINWMRYEYFTPDFFQATSLTDMIESFEENPPRTKRFRGKMQEAWVDINKVDVLVSGLLGDELINYELGSVEYIDALRSGQAQPVLYLRDITNTYPALWTGTAKDFEKAQFRFGFSPDRFVTTTECFCNYFVGDQGDPVLAVQAFGPCDYIQKDKARLFGLITQET